MMIKSSEEECREDFLHIHLYLTLLVAMVLFRYGNYLVSCKAIYHSQPLFVCSVFCVWNNTTFVVRRPCASLLLYYLHAH